MQYIDGNQFRFSSPILPPKLVLSTGAEKQRLHFISILRKDTWPWLTQGLYFEWCDK